jgi:hypothetical protein
MTGLWMHGANVMVGDLTRLLDARKARVAR